MMKLERREVPGRDVTLQLLDSGGDGFPVIFLHGVMGRAIHWHGTMAALAPRFRGIAIDQRGHGRSSQPDGPYDREAYVDDVERAIAALGVTRCAVVGHSTGALNAWVLASRRPELVAALVLEDMTAARRGGDFLDEWRRWMRGWPVPFASQAEIARFFAAVRPSLGPYFAEVFTEADDGWRPRFSVDAVLRTLEGNEAKDWWDELAAVECPTLVVRGGESEWLGRDEARRMAATLPRGRLAEIAGAGHTVHVDEPDAYRELVAGFLDEVVLGRATPPPRRYSDARLASMAREEYARGDAGFPLLRPALLLIDMQREFVDADGPYRVPAAAERVPAMARLLGAFRDRGLPVIHTAFAATHHYLDRPAFGAHMPNRARDVDAFRGAELVAPLAPRESEIVIHKPSYGAFFDTPLETILKRLQVSTVVLAGALTDCCVGTTARQAYERGFGAVVASDATATTLPELHDAELAILRRAFARVLDVDRILHELGAEVERAGDQMVG